jgi:hypothetical protein
LGHPTGSNATAGLALRVTGTTARWRYHWKGLKNRYIKKSWNFPENSKKF